MNLKKVVLVMFVLLIISVSMLNAQSRGGIGGTLKFNGTPVAQGTPLRILLYSNDFDQHVEAIPLSPAFVGSSGNFTTWLNPLIYTDTVFHEIAVRWTQPYCHTSADITSPRVAYSNQSITPIYFDFIGSIKCNACPTIRSSDGP